MSFQPRSSNSCHCFELLPLLVPGHGWTWWFFIYSFLSFFFSFIFISWRLITILWWFLPYIDMNQPWIYMYSPSWSPLPPPSLPDPSGSSQCTRPECLSHASHLGWFLLQLNIIRDSYLLAHCSVWSALSVYKMRVPENWPSHPMGHVSFTIHPLCQNSRWHSLSMLWTTGNKWPSSQRLKT